MIEAIIGGMLVGLAIYGGLWILQALWLAVAVAFKSMKGDL